MSLSKSYEQLAAQLGDVEYKLQALLQRKKSLIKQIECLDAVAGALNEKSSANKVLNETKNTPHSTTRGSSPT